MKHAKNAERPDLMKKKQRFKVRSYGFQELAQLYLPGIKPRSASVRLKGWISQNRKLSKNLAELGFGKGIKILTPEMVKEIVGYVGKP